jgi:hypothetical protein
MVDSFYFPLKDGPVERNFFKIPNYMPERIQMIYNNIEIYILNLYQNRTVSVSKPNWLTPFSTLFSLIIM